MKYKDKILAMLDQDGRLTAAQIARMLDASEEEIAAEIAELERANIILGYKAMIDWDKTAEEMVTAQIEVRITPQKGMGFDEIARQICSHPQVQSAYLMSGGFDLTIIIVGKTLREISQFVSENLAPMESVISTSTHFILKKYKDQGVEYDPSASDTREVMITW
ncbi:Lrp/AsnC family transcriptional regulator [Intestinibacillus sp. Marseille-P6563]|uniref:Lrp/AsnC family transcriptional regulator n=1 Tax=Intestinibacillus sp. Marseille-P6563 TaxID=2364792 RepID=UPI000F060EF8|nr:Lrp/AsnC family transcriptional regulator [Intestinibacillus sp. Marseille-P6563]